MHLLEIVSAKKSNGVVTHLRLLLPALAAQGHRVTVLTREGSPFGEEFAAMGLETLSSDLHRLPTDELKRIGDWAKAERVDVIHAHMSRANNFGARLRQKIGIPCVMTAHAQVWHPHWRVADRILAVSEATAHWHRRWNRIPSDRIETIWNFLDPDRLAPSRDARGRVRAGWGVGEDEVLLGAVGDIIPRKGIDVLTAALARMPNPPRLVVVGRGEAGYVERLQRRAGGERAIWAGFRSDIPDVLAALDGVVLASRCEPFGLSLLEGMAVGLPVVGSRVDGIPELVKEGESGFLASPGDPQDLARALNALAALSPEERRAFGQHGRAFVTDNATVASQAPKIEAALARVCHKSPAR